MHGDFGVFCKEFYYCTHKFINLLSQLWIELFLTTLYNLFAFTLHWYKTFSNIYCYEDILSFGKCLNDHRFERGKGMTVKLNKDLSLNKYKTYKDF